MPRPYVICHMGSSVDGRVRTKRWSPFDGADDAYETVHAKLGGNAWICGRVTMNGYAMGEPPPPYDGPALPRETFVGKPDAKSWAIGLDAHGKMHWGTRNDITGDHVVVVLTEQVGDAHLAALRKAGVSYVFGGRDGIDIAHTLDILAATFGIERLLLEGGGRINGSFLKAGCIDELSLLLMPTVDGLMGQPAVFDYEGAADDETPKDYKLTLRSHELLDGGVMWLRYGLKRR